MFISSFRKLIPNRLPHAALSAMVMIMFFEMAVVYFDNELYADVKNGIFAKIKSQLSSFPGNQFDVLIMGDCFNQTGVAPEIINKKTGLNSFNFSTDAYHTVMSPYLMLKNYVRTSQKIPKNLVIGFHPKVWSQTREDVIDNYLFALYDYKNGNMGALIKEFGFFETAKLLIPSLKHQKFIKSTSLRVLFYRLPMKKKVDDYLYDYMFRFKGLYWPWADKSAVSDPPPGCGPQWIISPFFQKYLKLILNLSKENNIKVFYVVPSAPPKWSQQKEECKYNQNITDFLNSIKPNYPNLEILYIQDLLNENYLYYDNLHLNLKGVEIYSQYLADVINKDSKN